MAECDQCHKHTDQLRRCSGCQAAWYCSRECQKQHWSQHKRFCNKGKSKQDGETVTGSKLNAVCGADADRKLQGLEATAEVAEKGIFATCNYCAKQGRNLQKCGRCHEMTYCSRVCQQKDWRSHKLSCQPLDVITTDGYRQKKEKEDAERRAMQEREKATKHLLDSTFARMMGDIHLTPTLTWKEAISRAVRLYPRKRIVDVFSQLDNDFFHAPNVEGVVMIARMTDVYPHWFRHGRCLEDSTGNQTFVLFYNSEDPMPYFKYDQLRSGNFLCIENAHMHGFADGTIGFRVNDPRCVHIMEPQ